MGVLGVGVLRFGIAGLVVGVEGLEVQGVGFQRFRGVGFAAQG